MTHINGAKDGITLEIKTIHGFISLRGDSRNQSFISNVENALGYSLPLQPLTFSNYKECYAYWLAPDSWLISIKLDLVQELITKLNNALINSHVSVTDVSDVYSVIIVCGKHARELLMRCGTLDFYKRAFCAGMVAKGGFMKTVSIYCLMEENPDRFELFIPRSYSEYAWKCLKAHISSL